MPVIKNQKEFAELCIVSKSEILSILSNNNTIKHKNRMKKPPPAKNDFNIWYLLKAIPVASPVVLNEKPININEENNTAGTLYKTQFFQSIDGFADTKASTLFISI